ncbi:MAG: tryptophan synthase subunit alpha [Pseudomonadota bacterium]|nr:tryptophan synthase subunit alpha [Pseudomonadota bacterium]
MKRIAECFKSLRSEGKKGLVTFVTAGDPNLESTLDFMRALVRGGTNIIELGVPFSDPMADGPTIQRSSERALSAGTDLKSIFRIVERFRERDKETPVVLMGYVNPFEKMGFKKFASDASRVGVDGVLVVDLPPDESWTQNAALRATGIDQVFLVAPNSSTSRVKKIGKLASGFVYFVSVKGVTGDKTIAADSIRDQVAAVRASTELPIGLGFGIKTPNNAREAANMSDAIVVGSALVEIIEENRDAKKTEDLLERFVREIRGAIDE